MSERSCVRHVGKKQVFEVRNEVELVAKGKKRKKKAISIMATDFKYSFLVPEICPGLMESGSVHVCFQLDSRLF